MTLYNKNIETLGNKTVNHETNFYNCKHYENPSDIFMQNFVLSRGYGGFLAKGEYEHPVLYYELSLSIPDLVYFRKQLIDYGTEIYAKYIVENKVVGWYDDGTPASYENIVDTYNFTRDIMDHFKDCYEIQGFIDAWFVSSF